MEKVSNVFRKKGSEGQSLVETALFLPILLILLAGVVELSNLVLIQNRISNAARVAARFGANGGLDEGMPIVALNSVTQTLPLGEGMWDIWSIRGLVNADGTGLDEWQFVHVYGISNTVNFGSIDEAALQQEVLTRLQTDTAGQSNDTVAGDVRFVGTLVLHDAEAILGLQAIPYLTNLYTIRGLNVMRRPGTVELDPTKGCDAFPIILEESILSVTPEVWASLNVTGNTRPDPFPTYNNFMRAHPNHKGGVSLVNAREGYIYTIRQGTGVGNFGWLLWNKYLTPNEGNLQGSLTWPGNSSDYSTNPPKGYINFLDDDDREMSVGDAVTGNTGAVVSTSVRATLDEHLDRGRVLRLLLWRNEAGGSGGSGSNTWYRIVRFALFRLHGHNLAGNNEQSWILAEFIGFDDSCGQTVGAGP